jgi:hypothetical protein
MHCGSVTKKGLEKALRYLAARARLVPWAAEGVTPHLTQLLLNSSAGGRR